MTYKAYKSGYVMWQDSILIPVKRKDGSKTWWRKEIDFEDATHYWEYVCEDGSWNVYYVKRGANRRLAQCHIGKFPPESILCRIQDRDITVSDCSRVEEEPGHIVDRTPIASVIWSEDFDSKTVFELMEKWPKMPFLHIKMVIENEGGSIDNAGVIHKGNN